MDIYQWKIHIEGASNFYWGAGVDEEDARTRFLALHDAISETPRPTIVRVERGELFCEAPPDWATSTIEVVAKDVHDKDAKELARTRATLDLTSTDELVEALRRRSDASVVALLRHNTDDEDATDIYNDGSLFECLGLTGYSERLITDRIKDTRRDADGEGI
jgi:hypothetical protein